VLEEPRRNDTWKTSSERNEMKNGDEHGGSGDVRKNDNAIPENALPSQTTWKEA